jgi:hypothetical protein
MSIIHINTSFNQPCRVNFKSFETFVQTFVYFVVKFRLSLTTKVTKDFTKVAKDLKLKAER